MLFVVHISSSGSSGSSGVFFINIGCHGFNGFLFSFSFSFSFPCRPSRSSNLVPRLAVVGGVLLAILADCKQPKNKNTLDYDVVPADGVEPPQGHAGRGMG